MSLVKFYVYEIFLIPNSGKKDGVRKVAQPLWLTEGLGIIFVGRDCDWFLQSKGQWII